MKFLLQGLLAAILGVLIAEGLRGGKGGEAHRPSPPVAPVADMEMATAYPVAVVMPSPPPPVPPDYSNLKWQYMVVKLTKAVPGGFIAHWHQEGGPVGETARAIRGIFSSQNPYLEPSQPLYQTPSTDRSRPLFIEGVKGEVAIGQVMRGQAARAGVVKIGGQPVERWICKP